jgi:hypothetical protein
MVQALLDGRKTQTRRVVKKKYSNTDLTWKEIHSGKTKILVELQNDVPAPVKNENGTTTHRLRAYHVSECPYKVGDVLWVRETFYECEAPKLKGDFIYKASNDEGWELKWKPSIFMPKPACRIFLKIKSIRVERLQEISESDAIAEGIIEILPQMYPQYREWKNYINPCNPHGYKSDYNNPINSFKSLWQSINGKDSWNVNPFVWVYEFEQIEKPNDFIV